MYLTKTGVVLYISCDYFICNTNLDLQIVYGPWVPKLPFTMHRNKLNANVAILLATVLKIAIYSVNAALL